MSRTRLMLIALGMAFAVPALTGAKVPLVTALAPESICAPQPDPKVLGYALAVALARLPSSRLRQRHRHSCTHVCVQRSR